MSATENVRGLLRFLRHGISAEPLQPLLDLTFVCAGGYVVNAHRAIMTNFSELLAAAVSSSGSTPFSSDPVTFVYLPDFAAASVERLVEMAYTGVCFMDKAGETAEVAELLALAGIKSAIAFDSVENFNNVVETR